MNNAQFTKATVLNGKIRTEQYTLDDLNHSVSKVKKMKSNGEPSAKINFYDNEVHFEIDEIITFLEQMIIFYQEKIRVLQKQFEQL